MQNGHDVNSAWIQATLAQFEGPLTRYALRITRDAEAARDVVQETFLRLCREEPASRDGHLAEWLYTVCRNKALDVRRKEQRMTTLTADALDTCASTVSTPVDSATMQDSAQQALLLMGRLPENQQEVLRLKFQESLSYREISTITGLSESHVGVLIHLGIKTLRQQLRDKPSP